MKIKKIPSPFSSKNDSIKDVKNSSLPAKGAGIAIIGLGNPDRGDDVIGLLACEYLQKKFPEASCFKESEIHVEDMILSIIENDRTKEVIFIDAADMNEKAGTIKIIPDLDAFPLRLSTHEVPLEILFALLKKHGKKVFLVAIQVSDITFSLDARSKLDQALLANIEEKIKDLL